MSRWINIDELPTVIVYGSDGYITAYSERDVDEAESIDIVRCIDCRYCKESGGHANCNGWLTCKKQGRTVDEDDFCSRGKRNE